MPENTRKLCFYIAIGLTALMIMFPPFTLSVGGFQGAAFDEYGFLLSGPPTARQALGAAAAFGGADAVRMAGDAMPYRLDLVRLMIQVAVVWGFYVALIRTVLKRAAPAR